jgi:hypothetical protein
MYISRREAARNDNISIDRQRAFPARKTPRAPQVVALDFRMLKALERRRSTSHSLQSSIVIEPRGLLCPQTILP